MKFAGFHGLGAVDPATAWAIIDATVPLPTGTSGADGSEQLTYAINQRNTMFAQLTAGYVAPGTVTAQPPAAGPTLITNTPSTPAPKPLTAPPPLATSPAQTTAATPANAQGLTDIDVQSAQFPTWVQAHGPIEDLPVSKPVWPWVLGALALLGIGS